MNNCLTGLRLLVLPFAIALFAGCSREAGRVLRKPGLHVAEGHDKSIAEMKPDDVIVVVNGDKITKLDYDALLRFRKALFQLQRKIDVEDVENPEVRFFADQIRFRLVPELIHHKMFAQYAAEKGIVPSQEAVEKERKAFAQGLSRQPDELDRLAKRIGGVAGELFARAPFVSAQDHLLRQSVTTNDLDHVTDEELEQTKRRIEAWDKTAEGNNRASKERLAKARAEIDAGGDFADVTTKYAQVHPEYGKQWQTFELGELPQDEGLYKWLVSAKVGDISPPLDLEDGLAIVKLVSTGKGEAPPGVPLPDVYTLVRCTVFAYEYMEHLGAPEMRREVLKMKRTAAQRELGMMLTARAVLEYPNGTNFFSSVTEPIEEH